MIVVTKPDELYRYTANNAQDLHFDYSRIANAQMNTEQFSETQHMIKNVLSVVRRRQQTIL